MATALADDELLLETRLPLLAPDTRFGFYEFSRRAGDYAIAMALATFRLRDGVIFEPRVGVGGVEGRPRRISAAEAILAGRKPDSRKLSALRRTPRLRRSSHWKTCMRMPSSGSIWCAL